MLSFFKKKSPETEVAEVALDIHNQSIDQGEDALLRELGYKDTLDLRETIYGKFASPSLSYQFVLCNTS